MKIYTIEKNNMYLMDVGVTDWTEEWDNALIFASRGRAEHEFKMIPLDELENAKVIEYEVGLIKPIEKVDSWKVYIISDGEGYYKIGYSDDAIKRKKQLQTGNSKKLRIEGWFNRETEDGARRLEKMLHEYYKEHRISGEWFFDEDDQFSALVQNSHKNDKTFERYIG